MNTRETCVPKETPNKVEACLVAATEEKILLVTNETLGQGSTLPTDPVIHNEVTQESEMVTDAQFKMPMTLLQLQQKLIKSTTSINYATQRA
jgi:hypothetical protein